MDFKKEIKVTSENATTRDTIVKQVARRPMPMFTLPGMKVVWNSRTKIEGEWVKRTFSFRTDNNLPENDDLFEIPDSIFTQSKKVNQRFRTADDKN